jgi:hypothetical protein
VQTIVDSFGDPEELLVRMDDDPANIHAGAAGERQERRQHLGDAATARGGSHVPDGPAGEKAFGDIGGMQQGCVLVRGQDRGEAVERFGDEGHGLELSLAAFGTVGNFEHRGTCAASRTAEKWAL